MKIQGKILAIGTLGILLFCGSAMANDAGCGLGSLVISKNSKLLQLFALTTNGTFLNQAFGITSGTSGCSSSGLVQNEKEVQYFVELNNDDLSRQMARGEGEKLQVLAQLSGCKKTEGQKAFAEMTKKSFTQIYPTGDESAQDVISHLKAEMKNNPEVQTTCSVSAS